MIKQVALLKAKPDMARDAFIARYEDGHVPLIRKILPYFQDYRRNYLIPGSMVAMPHIGDAAAKPDIDVVTELWYESQDQFDRARRDIAETKAGDAIAEDETHLFDRSRTAIFVADEFVTAPSQVAPRPAGHQGRPAVKMICLLKKKPGMNRKDFIAHYENCHAPLALRLMVRDGVPLFAEYRRTLPADEAQVPAIGFDVMTGIWFWTEADYRQFVELCADPAIGAEVSADEENLFDRPSMILFLADERICA